MKQINCQPLCNKQIVILQKYIDNDICEIDNDIDFLNIQYQIKMHKNKIDILNYYILFSDDWVNIMNLIENDYKQLNKYEKFIKNHSIQEIIQFYMPNIWVSQFNDDGSVKNKHPELFSIYEKQIKILNAK